jgi:hypothetical protein
VTESAVHREQGTPEDDTVESEEILISRIAADRRSGKDTTQGVAALLRRAGKQNKAALDRLAK